MPVSKPVDGEAVRLIPFAIMLLRMKGHKLADKHNFDDNNTTHPSCIHPSRTALKHPKMSPHEHCVKVSLCHLKLTLGPKDMTMYGRQAKLHPS